MGPTYKSLDADDDVLSIGINRAVALLAEAKLRGRTLGNHPKDGQPVEVKRGRFGPYVQHGKRVASLPRGAEMEEATLDQAVALLAEKGKELKPRGAKGGAAASRGAARKGAAARREVATAGGEDAPPAPPKPAPRKATAPAARGAAKPAGKAKAKPKAAAGAAKARAGAKAQAAKKTSAAGKASR
jgi:DNA topoisomerase-1